MKWISRLAQQANDLREDFDEFDRNKDQLVDAEEVFSYRQILIEPQFNFMKVS